MGSGKSMAFSGYLRQRQQKDWQRVLSGRTKLSSGVFHSKCLTPLNFTKVRATASCDVCGVCVGSQDSTEGYVRCLRAWLNLITRDWIKWQRTLPVGRQQQSC